MAGEVGDRESVAEFQAFPVMTTSSKLPEGLYMFEQPFLRVILSFYFVYINVDISVYHGWRLTKAPYESVRRQFRATQKHVERDMGALKNSSKELSKKPNMTSQDAIKALDAMIAKVDGLNKKVNTLHNSFILYILYSPF